jgi:hypothetical protein
MGEETRGGAGQTRVKGGLLSVFDRPCRMAAPTAPDPRDRETVANEEVKMENAGTGNPRLGASLAKGTLHCGEHQTQQPQAKGKLGSVCLVSWSTCLWAWKSQARCKLGKVYIALRRTPK